jgi:hypothetical protein
MLVLMRKFAPVRIAVCGLAGLLLAFAQTPAASDYKALFAARDWTGLQRALGRPNAQAPLYRAAFSIAFNQDPAGAEKLLRSVIEAAPHSDDAYQAYEQLSHLYLRTGQYRRLMDVMEARWKAFPEKTGDRVNEESFLGRSGACRISAPCAASRRASPMRATVFLFPHRSTASL